MRIKHISYRCTRREDPVYRRGHRRRDIGIGRVLDCRSGQKDIAAANGKTGEIGSYRFPKPSLNFVTHDGLAQFVADGKPDVDSFVFSRAVKQDKIFARYARPFSVDIIELKFFA